MKKMQEDILRRTKRFGKKYDAEKDDHSPVEKQILRRLSDEQGELSGIMRRFIAQFEKQKEEAEKGREE
ncbi:MAG: hypothetical protein ACYTAF_00040 [Planctomycetota bacterium]|jgi:hypothetical protein